MSKLYAPFSDNQLLLPRSSFPALDDPLERGLVCAFPMTEVGSVRLDEAVQRGSVSIATAPAAVWYPDGGLDLVWGTGGEYIKGTMQLPISISVWVRKIASLNSAGILCAFVGTGASVLDIRAEPLSGGNQFKLSYYSSSVYEIATTSSQVLTGWSHLAAVTTESYRRLYFNGRLEAENTTFQSQFSAYTGFYLFQYGVSGFPYNGAVRDLRTWNRTLDDREVFELYSRGYAKVGEPVQRARYFNIPFDEPTPPKISLIENSYRDYLPYARKVAPALDDPLARELKCAFPMTEYGSARIDDSIQGGSVPVEAAQFDWQPEGGLKVVSNTTHLYQQALIPTLPITFSSWHRKLSGVSPSNIYYAATAALAVPSTIDLRAEPFANGNQFRLLYQAGSVETLTTISSQVESEWSHVLCV